MSDQVEPSPATPEGAPHPQVDPTMLTVQLRASETPTDSITFMEPSPRGETLRGVLRESTEA